MRTAAAEQGRRFRGAWPIAIWPGAVLPLLLGAVLHAAERPGLEFQGLGVSLGPGRPVTAKVTFDRRTAAAGGWIYACPRTAPEDETAIRLSEAVLTTSGGLLSHAAISARERRVPALIMPLARWEAGPVLVLDKPLFGSARRSPEGFSFRLVEKTLTRRVREGDVVTVDPALGALRLYEESEQSRELELARALRAYEGLKDPQSLVLWFAGKAVEPGETAALGERLLDEVAQRVLEGPSAASEYAAVRKGVEAALPPGARAGLRAGERRLVARHLRSAVGRLHEIETALREAGTADAAERLGDRAKSRWESSRALARWAGVEDLLGAAPAVYARVSRLAQGRLAELRRRKAVSMADAVSAAGGSVPPQATLAAGLFRRFLAEGGLELVIGETAQDASLDLRRKSERIRSLILAAPLAADSALGREILGLIPKSAAYTVAGAGEPRRYVPASSLLDEVKVAWASYWTAAALGERKRGGGQAQPEAEVTVLAAPKAEASGVLFTRGTAAGGRERLVVDAVLGELEGLLSGRTPADQYVLDRRSGREVLPALVADKREKLEFDLARRTLRSVVVPPGVSLSRVLSARRLERLARVGRALENHFGRGLEVEFAVSGDSLWILAARPLAGEEALPSSPDPFAVTPAAPTVPGVLPVR